MIDERSMQSLPEPERDPQLAREIRDAEGALTSAARLELLRSRIAVAAAAVLEARRERAWWEWMTHWARAEVALAAAATIVAMAIGGATMIGRGEVASDTVVASNTVATPLDSVVSRALAAGASSEQVMNALVGPATGDWLLTQTVSR